MVKIIKGATAKAMKNNYITLWKFFPSNVCSIMQTPQALAITKRQEKIGFQQF